MNFAPVRISPCCHFTRFSMTAKNGKHKQFAKKSKNVEGWWFRLKFLVFGDGHSWVIYFFLLGTIQVIVLDSSPSRNIWNIVAVMTLIQGKKVFHANISFNYTPLSDTISHRRKVTLSNHTKYAINGNVRRWKYWNISRSTKSGMFPCVLMESNK